MDNSRATRRIEAIAKQLDVEGQSQVHTTTTPTASRHVVEYPNPKCDYDVIVIGGGIHGSATTEAIAKKGKKVLLLEQFDVNHEEGSSHGDGRIIRFSYPETVYIEMSKIAYPLWMDIEKRNGSKLIHITGGLTWGPEDDVDLANLKKNLAGSGIQYEVLTPEEANKRFPVYRIPAGNTVVYQKDSGVVFASKAVKAFWDLAKRQGATIMPNEKVVGLKVVNDRHAIVSTQSGKKFTAEKLVITAGAWAKSLLLQLNLDLPLEVTQEQVYYWKEKNLSNKHHMTNMPVFIVHGKQLFYGLPQIDIPGVKVAWHGSGNVIDTSNKKTGEFSKEKDVIKFVSQVFPELDNTAAVHKLHCLYTNTADGHFILDHHPIHKNVIIGSPCSGHGFKFGPAVGALLAGLALNETLPLSLDAFKIARFSSRIVKRAAV